MGPQSHRLVQVVLFWNVLVCQQWLSTTEISILNVQPWPDGHVCPGEKSLQIFPSNSPGPKGFLPHLAFPGCRGVLLRPSTFRSSILLLQALPSLCSLLPCALSERIKSLGGVGGVGMQPLGELPPVLQFCHQPEGADKNWCFLDTSLSIWSPDFQPLELCRIRKYSLKKLNILNSLQKFYSLQYQFPQLLLLLYLNLSGFSSFLRQSFAYNDLL